MKRFVVVLVALFCSITLVGCFGKSKAPQKPVDIWASAVESDFEEFNGSLEVNYLNAFKNAYIVNGSNIVDEETVNYSATIVEYNDKIEGKLTIDADDYSYEVYILNKRAYALYTFFNDRGQASTEKFSFSLDYKSMDTSYVHEHANVIVEMLQSIKRESENVQDIVLNELAHSNNVADIYKIETASVENYKVSLNYDLESGGNLTRNNIVLKLYFSSNNIVEFDYNCVGVRTTQTSVSNTVISYNFKTTNSRVNFPTLQGYEQVV